MISKIKHKNILGLCLVVLFLGVVAYSIRAVFAVDVPSGPATDEGTTEKAKEVCSTMYKNVQLIERYGITVDLQGNNSYKISLNPEESDSNTLKKLKQIKFNVIEVNGKSYENNTVVSYGNPITLEIPSVKQNTEGEDSYEFNGVSFKLRFTEESTDPDCSGRASIYVSYTVNQPKNETEAVDPIPDYGTETARQQIECKSTWKTDYKDNEFNYEFCKAKTAVPNADKNILEETETASSKYGIQLFKCDVNQFWKETDLEGDYYYKDINTKYLFARRITTEKSTSAYVYHYAPGNIVTGDTPSCKVTCDEAVTVQYGAPVASKAGLCFEYKVKVTSRVSCAMTEKPVKPKTPNNVCTPAPTCTNAARTYFVRQGGPNEEYDECVNKCDGGKYTSECSNKCYKEVYGSSSTVKSVADSTAFLAEKTAVHDASEFTVENCAKNSGYNGCYYYSGNSILWYTNGSKTYKHTDGVNYYWPGRWYRTTNWYSAHNSTIYGVHQNDGFFRHTRTNDYCHDYCTWGGCSKDSYLNYGVASKDRDNNNQIYQTLVDACAAKAKCSESIAEFTIQADYINNENKVIEINFPRNSKGDNSSKDQIASNGVESKLPNTTGDKNTTITKDSSGRANANWCYDKNSETLNAYQVEWSFNTWLNDKTGEISYISKTGETAWTKKDKKFCIPFDAQDVNVKWWNKYQIETLSGESTSSINNGTCPLDTSNYDKNITYNIKAETKNFGYLSWDITMQCFYAINSNLSTKNECRLDTTGKVRTVDLNNLFPNENGDSLSDTNSSGRTVGFNWSSYADVSNVKDKNGNLINTFASSSPVAYMGAVQKLGNKVYDDEYLDYEFVLTPDTISQMRKITKTNGKNYTAYTGETKRGNSGVTRYMSDLFRSNSNVKFEKIKVSNDEFTLDCNNMINYNQNGCSNAQEVSNE